VKFKTIILDANDEYDFLSDVYSSPRIEFAWLGKLTPKKTRVKLHTYFHGCRETFAAAFTAFDDEKGCEISKDYACIALYKRHSKPTARQRMSFEAKLAKAIKIIHHYEKMVGWKRTKIYRATVVQDDYTDKSLLLYVVDGSRLWLRSPHLLSLYTLLLRMGNLTHLPMDFKDDEELQFGFRKMLTEYRGRTGDVGFLACSFNKFPTLLRNASYIYRGISSESLWVDYNQWEGIGKLCQGVCGNKTVLKRFQQKLEAGA